MDWPSGPTVRSTFPTIYAGEFIELSIAVVRSDLATTLHRAQAPQLRPVKSLERTPVRPRAHTQTLARPYPALLSPKGRRQRWLHSVSEFTAARWAEQHAPVATATEGRARLWART